MESLSVLQHLAARPSNPRIVQAIFTMRDDAVAPGWGLVLRGEQPHRDSGKCDPVLSAVLVPVGQKETGFREVLPDREHDPPRRAQLRGEYQTDPRHPQRDE